MKGFAGFFRAAGRPAAVSGVAMTVALATFPQSALAKPLDTTLIQPMPAQMVVVRTDGGPADAGQAALPAVAQPLDFDLADVSDQTNPLETGATPAAMAMTEALRPLSLQAAGFRAAGFQQAGGMHGGDEDSAALFPLGDLGDPAATLPTYGPAQLAQSRIEQGEGSRNRLSFGRQVGAIKWELGIAVAWMTATNIAKVSKDGGHSFRFKDEGWFGDDTINLGMDKLAHAWNTFWLTDLIEARIRRKTGAENAAVPAALLSMGLMLYSEMWDAHKDTSGFSFQDVAMNAAGAGFSALRNSVPGLEEKLDFRLLLIPNKDIYTLSGTRHYRQMRYLLALKLSGFKGMEDSPLRFLELHAGYRATGFTPAEERRNAPRRQVPFVGIGINLNELFFKKPQGWAGRAARETLHYVQIPYTAYHID